MAGQALPGEQEALTEQVQESSVKEESLRKAASTVLKLTPEEAKSDAYITAIHELNRLSRKWSPDRLDRIAGNLGLKSEQLRLTWCLLQATERTRQKTPGARPGGERSYLQVLHGLPRKPQLETRPHGKLSQGDVREAMETLLTAGCGVLGRRKRVAAMLKGSEIELQIREEGEYEDNVSLSEDDNESSVEGMCMRAVKELPGAENLPQEVLSNVNRHVAAFAESLKQGEEPEGPSDDALWMAAHRTEAVRWLSYTTNSSRMLKRRRAMAAAIDEIGQEANFRLHPVTKRALKNAFVDESSMAEGGLSAFRALVPEKVEEVVKAREVQRLKGWMKTSDQGVAEKLIGVFGSARRCVRADASKIEDIFGGDGIQVMEKIHGLDASLHNVLTGQVDAVWLICRVLNDKFGGLLAAQKADFGTFMDGRGEVVELTTDERLNAYRAIHEGCQGMDREVYKASWGLFRAVCMYTKAEDCVSLTKSLLAKPDGSTQSGSSVLGKLAKEDVWSMCIRIGIDSDEASRLKRFAVGWISGNVHHQ